MPSDSLVREIRIAPPLGGIMDGKDPALDDAQYPSIYVPDLQNLRVSGGKWSARKGSTLWKTLPGSGDVRWLYDAYTSPTIRIRLAARGTGANATLYDYVEGTDSSFNATSGGTGLGGTTHLLFQGVTLNGKVYLTDRAGPLRVYQESPSSGNQLRTVALPTKPSAAPGVKPKTYDVLEAWPGVAPYGWTRSSAVAFDIVAGTVTDSPIGGTVVKLDTLTSPQGHTIRENVSAEAVPSNTIAFWIYPTNAPSHVAFQYGQITQTDYTELLDAPTANTWYPVFVAIGSLGTLNYKQFTVTENGGAADVYVSKMVLPGRLDGSYRWVYTHYDPALLRESEPSAISNGGTPLDLSAIGTTFATATAAAFQKSAALTFTSDAGTDATTTKVRFYRSGGLSALTKDINSGIDLWCFVGEVLDFTSQVDGATLAGASTMILDSVTGLVIGDWLVIEKGTVSKEEYGRITAINTGTRTVTFSNPLTYAHSDNVAVQMAFIDNVANDTVDASNRIDLERDDPPAGCLYIQKAPDGRLWAFCEDEIAVSNLATPLRPTDYEVFPSGIDPFTRQDPLQGFRAAVYGDANDEKVVWGGFFNDRPYVLTRRNMYAINATSQVNWNSYAITKIHATGCIAGDTVCEVGGVLYWVADGPRIVRWTGQGDPQVISHQRVNTRLLAAPTSRWGQWFARRHQKPSGNYYSLYYAGEGTAEEAINPLDYPHLEEYYDSRLGFSGYTHGQTVTTWEDFSGNGRDQGVNGGFDSPTYLLTSSLSPNGLPRVHFDGEEMSLSGGSLSPFPTETRGHTFYCKGLWRPTLSPPAIFDRAMLWYTTAFTSAPKELLTQAPNSGDKWGWRDSGATPLLQPSAYGELLFTWVFEPPSGTGVCKLYLNGVLVDQSTVWTVGGATDTETLISNPFLPVNADLDFFAWYTDAHDAATVAAFYQFGLSVWG